MILYLTYLLLILFLFLSLLFFFSESPLEVTESNFCLNCEPEKFLIFFSFFFVVAHIMGFHGHSLEKDYYIKDKNLQ